MMTTSYLARTLAGSSLLTACLACPACGSVDDSVDDVVTLEGSYTLVVESAEPDEAGSDAIRLEDLEEGHGTVGNLARLDIQATTGNNLEVFLTPRWGRSSRLAVAKTSPALEVFGEVVFPRPHAGGSIDNWRSIHLTFDRRADGSLAGTFALAGTLLQPRGDWAPQAQIKGKGSVRTDDVVPEMRIVPPRPSRGGKWLPWDDVTVELAEPLVAAPFAETFRALGEHVWPGAGVTEEVMFFLGTVGATLPAPGARSIISPDGAKDRRGNALAPFSGEVEFHDVGRQSDAFTFDADVHLAKWGGAQRVEDVHCEKGGCMIVRLDPEGCREPSGFAGVITPTRSASVLRVRARFFTSEDQQKGSPVPMPTGIEVFAKGTRPAARALEAAPLTLTSTKEDPAMPWTTAWHTLEFPLPADAKEVGFSVHSTTCDAFAVHVPAGALVVDEIRVE